MLHEITSNYKEIAKYFPELRNKISLKNHTKHILIEMAKNGENKPPKNTDLGVALSRFTNPNIGCYDQSFTKKIKKIRPKWFLVQTKEKNRQVQIKVIFKLVEILCRGKWLTVDQLRHELSESGYPRCYKSIKRLLRVLCDIDFNLLCDDKEVPFKYKADKKWF